RRSSLIEVATFIYAHLDRRPKPDTTGVDRLPAIKRTHALLDACGARLVTGGTQPLYDPTNDVIIMPSPTFFHLGRLFTSRPTYAFVLLHELCHWSGHRSRLARPTHRQQFDLIYQREECLAELG